MSGQRIYCTYFDHRYLARALAMIRSLRRFVPDARILALCLDDDAANVLVKLNEPGVRIIPLDAFEEDDTALLDAKADGRSLIEYYFTCTPSLIAYAMRKESDADIVTYLDGDLWFFADPEPIYTELGTESVLIVPHRFPAAIREREKFGVYNVGWVSFRRDLNGQACLAWWRERTLEWCRDHVDENHQRFADQRYLDRFPTLFEGVHIVQHRGANLAPWNLARHALHLMDGFVIIDRLDPLLFFHFHGLKRLWRRLFLTIEHAYGAPPNSVVKRSIYRPYLRSLLSIEREVCMLAGGRDRDALRNLNPPGPVRWGPQPFRVAANIAIAWMRGQTVTG